MTRSRQASDELSSVPCQGIRRNCRNHGALGIRPVLWSFSLVVLVPMATVIHQRISSDVEIGSQSLLRRVLQKMQSERSFPCWQNFSGLQYLHRLWP